VNRERTGRLRVLSIAPFAPSREVAHGGGRLLSQLLRGLSSRHEMALLCLRGAGEPDIDADIADRCAIAESFVRGRGRRGSIVARARKTVRSAVSLIRPRPVWATHCASPEIAARIREVAAAWRPDIVQLEFHVMGQYAIAAGNDALRVLNEHEPGVAAALDRVRSAHGAARVRQYADLLAWRRFEPAVLARMDAVVVFTERDRAALDGMLAPERIHTIAPGTDLPAEPVHESEASTSNVLFFGSYDHPPNVEAARRLVHHIFPRIRSRVPGATLHIVGENPPDDVRAAAGDGIVVPGRVPDLGPWLERAAVVVAPIATGGGMRIKVLEALAAGKAVVATPRALEGLAVTDGVEIRVAESDDSFADAVSTLLDQPDERQRLGSAAREWACANLGLDRALDTYDRLYASLLARRSDDTAVGSR
jgi:glycosyltransferase involved in cell wall biosynthesis